MSENEHQRGQMAESLLNNAVLQEALAAIECEVIAQWEACPARDQDGREQLWMLYKISKKFRGLLDGYVQTGKLAAENMRLEKERRFKIF